MPYAVVIDAELRLVVTKASGSVTLEDVAAHRAELMAHPAFLSDFAQVLDVRGTGFLPAFDELRRLSVKDAFSMESRRAVLVDSTVQFGVARTYSGLRAGVGAGLQPFQSLADACEWIGVPMDAVVRLLDAI